MKVYQVTIEALAAIVRTVSAEQYAGNIVFKNGPNQATKNCVNFTLTVADSNANGSRRSNTGRRIAAACWHAHRDIMQAIFAAYPDARLHSALADYRGQSDFLASFPATGATNCGSIANPLRADNACDCNNNGV